MSFRLQRSIKIVKGVRLNISKSGLGVSVGPRGAKISAGPRGVYASAGLPGSGLSTRQKISGSVSSGGSSSSQNTGSFNGSINVKISIDEETGKETVTLSANENEIKDDSLLRKIKKDPSYKNKLEEVRESVLLEVEEKTNILVKIHKYSVEMTDWDSISKEVSESHPDKYKKKTFTIKAPDKEEVLADLQAEANRNIRGILGIKKKKQDYVDEHFELRFSELLNGWQKDKATFEKKEIITEAEENKKNLDEYNSWLNEMNCLLNPDSIYIENRLDDLFSEIQLPVDFLVSYEVKNDGHTIIIDLDLPEIEDFPSTKAQILASGKISIKEKTLKERKEDYYTSISGLSVYFASIAFSSAPIIDTVIISGFTQRINKATGNIDDEYVYSVKYDKERFSKLKFQKIDPGMTLQSFDHRIDLSKTFELKTIEPLI